MSDMYSHYQINEIEKSLLVNKGITEVDMLKHLKLFDPNENNCEINKLSLMYYMDQYGDFREDNRTQHGCIANAVFESMTSIDKIAIFEYLEWLEEELEEEDMK